LRRTATFDALSIKIGLTASI